MGTRGFAGFVVNGEVRASYNHFDSYPTGLGRSVAKAAAEWTREARLSEVRVKAENMRLLAEDVKVPDPEAAGDMSDMNEAFHVYRGQQGDLDAMLWSGVMVTMHSTWPADSLFCEWGWLVNLDTCELEVYAGFQMANVPGLGRFAHLRDPDPDSDSEYGPVRHIGTFSLATLATLSADQIETLMAYVENRTNAAEENRGAVFFADGSIAVSQQWKDAA